MTEINELLTKMNACKEAKVWADRWAASGTNKTAWEACNRSDWMIWLLERTTIDQNDPRLRLMTCDFAEVVLHLVPNDEDRPRRAIKVARMFAVGEATREELAAAWDAAWAAARAAARDAARDAAWAAARAAARDAAWAAARAAARDAAWAAARDAAWAAAWAAARAAQCGIIRKYFPKCPPVKPVFL